MVLYYDDGHRVQVSSHHGQALEITTLCTWYYTTMTVRVQVSGHHGQALEITTLCTWYDDSHKV